AGLRFSDFVDGLQRDPADPLYRRYFVRLAGVPGGYEGTAGVLAVTVTSTTQPQLVVVDLRRKTASDITLPWTGLEVVVGSAAAAALLAAGILFLLAARRRRRPDSEEQ